MQNYLEINKQLWNTWAAAHLESDFYDVASFLAGRSSLHDIELSLLGDVRGKRILHLQCHFGQDTLSLARMGATVVGVDLSDTAIAAARQLAQQMNLPNAEFICCDVYSLPQHLNEEFDIVFSSYGTIGWLPDLRAWGEIVARYLRLQGTFVFAEFHPFVWAFDDDFQRIAYSYFNEKPIRETVENSYASGDSEAAGSYVSWNHPLSEVLTGLLDNGLTLRTFQEYDYSPYNCFRHTIEIAPNKFRIQHLDNKIPMVYALSAQKI